MRWQKERVVACDGGGGPLGHPKIFINVDKPQIVFCTYCGLPYVSLLRHILYVWHRLTATVQAHEQHREYLKSLPSTSYPLEPTGEAAEETQRLTEGAAEKR